MRASRRSFLLGTALLSAGLTGCKKSRPKDELIYVSCEDSGEIVIADPVKGEVVARVAVGKRPRGLKLAKDGDQLFVALSGSPRGGPNVDESKLPPADRKADGIGVVDVQTRKLLRSYPSGQDPETFDLSLDGKTLFISNEETAELSVLDLKSGSVARRIPVGKEPEGVTLRPDGLIVYVTSEEDGGISVIDTETLTAVAQVPTGSRPRAIAFAPNGATAFISDEIGGSVTVVDAIKHHPLTTIRLDPAASPPHRPMGLVITPNGKQLFVSTGRGGAIAEIDVAQQKAVRYFKDVGARPWGIALSRNGTKLYTANGSSNDVSIVDIASGKVDKRINVGGLPWGVVTG